jgi:very-short-patch-repair endonuclease
VGWDNSLLLLDHTNFTSIYARLNYRIFINTVAMSTGYYPVILYPPLARQFAQGYERQEHLKASFQGCVALPDGNGTAKQGVSEKNFFRHLLSAFPGNLICQAVEFEIPGYSLRYSADFILYHHSSGLALDIEIDEPYAGDTGKPHHCTDVDDDKIRNRFFLTRNWGVVRFAEIQVVCHPWGCCKVIAQIIARLTGDNSVFMLLQNLADVPLQKCWTRREARLMAKNNYRQSYLQSRYQ